MHQPDTRLSRRDFMKLGGLALGGLIVPPNLFEEDSNILKNSPLKENVKFPELLSKESKQGALTTRNMPVYSYPLRNDYFYQYWKNKKKNIPATIETFELNGIELSFKDVFTHKDKDGLLSKYIIFPYTTGSKNITLGLYEKGNIDASGNYLANNKYYTNERLYKAKEQGDAHTILAEFYPNKVLNVLESLRAIDEWQEQNGGFKKGQEYSLLEILNLLDRRGYRPGKTSAGSIVQGGGVCITATNFCKLQTLLGAQVLERWQHPTGSKYWTGPTASTLMSAANTDTTIEISDTTKFDFRWIAAQDSYIKFDVTIIPNGKKVKDPLGDSPDFGNISDAFLFLTMKHVPNNPNIAQSQSSNIADLMEKYLTYRSSNNDSSLNQSLEISGKLISETAWKSKDELTNFLQSIYPEEKRTTFQEELTTDSFYKGLLELSDLINDFDVEKSIDGIGTYLKNTKWYTNQCDLIQDEKFKKQFDAALRILDYSTWTVKNQPIQCVGFCILIASLHSKFKFPQIGGAQIDVAANLIPPDIKSGKSKISYLGQYCAKTIDTVSDINPGDLFVNFDNPVGHVGAVIGKKILGEKTILLFCDANRKTDGKLRMFEVDEDNLDAILTYPYIKSVLRTL